MKQWLRGTLLVTLALGLGASAGWATPPPWAPAHGYRRKARTVYYAPAPFIYSGVTYIPLRNMTSLLGAALLWDSLDGRATITYNGRDIGLVVGSRSLYYGGETVLLSAAPIVVRDVVYVPATFCEEYLEVPMRHSRGRVEFEGPHGWREYRVASAPPGRIIFSPSRTRVDPFLHSRERMRVTRERAPVWESSRPRVRVRSHGQQEPRVRARDQGRRERGAPRAEEPRGRGRDRGQGNEDQGNRGRGRGQGGGGGQGHGRGHGGD
jgi:hypothetical protein